MICIIKVLCLTFVIYEIAMLVMLELNTAYWIDLVWMNKVVRKYKLTHNQIDYLLRTNILCIYHRAWMYYIDLIYSVFLICLLFTPFWYVGLGIKLLSYISAHLCKRMSKDAFKLCLVVDKILSIVILLLPYGIGGITWLTI